MSQTRIALINARKEAHLTQKDLAEAVGISRAFLTNIELGKYSPSLDVAGRIADILGKDIDELFFDRQVRKTHKADILLTGTEG